MESRAFAAAGSFRPLQPLFSESQAHLGLDRAFVESTSNNFLRLKSHLKLQSSCLACPDLHRNFYKSISEAIGSNVYGSFPSNSYTPASKYMYFGKQVRETVLCSAQMRSSCLSEESQRCVDKYLMCSGVFEERCSCSVEDPILKNHQLKPVKLRDSVICKAVLPGFASATGCHSVAVDGSTLEPNLAVSLATPSMARGWLSVGVCGNALIARVGNDGRCFHQPNSSCEWKYWPEDKMAANNVCAHAALNASQGSLINLVRVGGSVEMLPLDCPPSSKPPITKKTQSEKLKRKSISRPKKRGNSAAPARDLYGRSSFHLCEVIFSPIMNSNLVFDIQCLSREGLRELVVVLNKAAVGIAGTGVALMLFVVSRMLAVNAILSNHMIIDVACGLAFVSLAWAMKRVADQVCSMADMLTKSRSPRKQDLIGLQNELRRCSLSVLPLIVLCLVRFG